MSEETKEPLEETPVTAETAETEQFHFTEKNMLLPGVLTVGTAVKAEM